MDDVENDRNGTTARRRTWSARVPRVATAALAAAVLGTAAGAGAALADDPEIGAPVTDQVRFMGAWPAALGKPLPETARLLPVTAPDPDGGPPWGMQIIKTDRAVGCIGTGRVVAGQLGLLGADGAFGDDGRFHAVPAPGAWRNCLTLDGRGQLFAGVQAMGVRANGSDTAEGCSVRALTRRETACAPDRVRNVFFGLLGPMAKSFAYRIDGQTHTAPTVGPEGAFMLVTRGRPGVSDGIVMGGPIMLNSPVDRIDFTDGTICKPKLRAAASGGSTPRGQFVFPCPLKGFAQEHSPRLTQRTTKVSARIEKTTLVRKVMPSITVRFKAPVAIPDARSSYTLRLQRVGSNSWSPTASTRDYRRGDRVVIRGLPNGAGTYRGTVRYEPPAGFGHDPEMPLERGPVIGRFTIKVP